jgi:hypothetical protein
MRVNWLSFTAFYGLVSGVTGSLCSYGTLTMNPWQGEGFFAWVLLFSHIKSSGE